jgi:hypothetical protein
MSTLASTKVEDGARSGAKVSGADSLASSELSDGLADTLVKAEAGIKGDASAADDPAKSGSILQPSKKVDAAHAKLCSLYAPANAIQIAEGTNFTAEKEAVLRDIIEKNKARDGGNPQKLYQEYYKAVYGLRATNMTLDGSQKRSWLAGCQMAQQLGLPVAVAVQWSKGKSSGNHWVYLVEVNESGITARDQQNGNMLISIDAGGWTGSASGGWKYTVTSLGVGVTADKYKDMSSAIQ